jgi:outer membrane receptor for ferrienterochelin and colicin
MKYIYTVIFLLVVQTWAVSQKKVTISGYLLDAENGEKLIGANVFDRRSLSGTATNTFGFYSLTLPSDSVRLVYSYIGYNPVEIKFLLQKDTVLNVRLELSTLEEIVISGARGDDIRETTQMSTIDIPISDVKSLPAFLGEVDVLKVMQLLPGVQSGNEGSSGLYVRGGGPDQNLILLDGVPVYNASHLFGFFSLFNADAINRVELIKGGFPARYGGRLSSVIDISMKEGNSQEFKGEASIGLIASKFTIEGPLKKNKTSFMLSGRRTYLDILAAPIIAATVDDEGTAGYFFYDLNFKLNHKFSDKDHLYFSTYAGDDKAYSRYQDDYTNNDETNEYKEQFGLRWGNIITALRWNHVLNQKLFSNTTLTYSRYRFEIFEKYEEKITRGDQVTKQFFNDSYKSGIRDYALKVDFDYIPAPAHYLRFGAMGIRHRFNPGAFSYRSNTEIDTTFGSQQLYANEISAYLEDDFKVNNWLKLNAGVHYSAFRVGGTFYQSWQPRFSMRALIGDSWTAKASYVRMTQFIHLLTNSGIGLPTDLWLPSTPNVKPQQAYQVAAGIARNIGNDFELSVEGYYKAMQNLIEYKEGATFINVDKDWQTKIETGDGESYGMEVFLQKKQGSVTGWLGYTLSWSNRQFDNLNFGRPFPYRYDRRHDISLALSKTVNKKIDYSFTWVYGTGNAVSLPIAQYQDNSNYFRQGPSWYFDSWDGIDHFESRNSFRMRAYHRLDASISFKKMKKRGERVWTIGVYNMYSRQNPFFMEIGYDDNGDKKFIQYSLFPIIPSVRYSFKF